VKISALIALLMMMSSSPTFAESLDIPHISVTGQSSKSIAPDELTWRISIRNLDKETSQVAKQHSQSVDSVLKYLMAQGIAQKNIQTTQMQLAENRKYEKSSTIIDGYFANSQIVFKLTDLDNYLTLWNGLAKFSEVSTSGINFGHSQAKSFKSELQQQALLNAREKAAQMAATLDMKLGKPLAIEELSWSPQPRAEVMRMADSGGSQQALAAGMIEFSESMKVVFRIE